MLDYLFDLGSEDSDSLSSGSDVGALELLFDAYIPQLGLKAIMDFSSEAEAKHAINCAFLTGITDDLTPADKTHLLYFRKFIDENGIDSPASGLLFGKNIVAFAVVTLMAINHTRVAATFGDTDVDFIANNSESVTAGIFAILNGCVEDGEELMVFSFNFLTYYFLKVVVSLPASDFAPQNSLSEEDMGDVIKEFIYETSNTNLESDIQDAKGLNWMEDLIG
jgi:hypothetical protein